VGTAHLFEKFVAVGRPRPPFLAQARRLRHQEELFRTVIHGLWAHPQVMKNSMVVVILALHFAA